jgi:hypothetical protein
LGARSDLFVGALIFTVVLVGLLALIGISAAGFAELDVLWSHGRVVPLARFCGFLALVTAYIAAASVVVRRGAARDFAALRNAARSTPEGWRGWVTRFTDRRGARVAAAVGALVGLGINRIGSAVGPFGDAPIWSGLFWWAALLNALLFANLAMLARHSLLEIRALRALGRRVPVSLLDRTALAPFVRAGVRSSVAWLLGSSLATTLVLDVNSPSLVIVVIAATMALSVAALLLPSAGLNERLRAEKERELAWVRGEIARAREALARLDAASREDAARLPALLAWETRVESASTWPFDTPTLLRFSLLLLIPIGSWLGGALVERAVGAMLG